MKNPRYLVAASALLAACVASSQAHAAAGDLDTTFGNQGRIVWGTYSFTSDMALLNDGKIVVAAAAFGWRVLRFAANGAVDTTFGTAGASEPAPFSNGSVASIAVQPDGYIVTAGTEFTGTPNMDFALARYDPDGNLDATFGSGGVVVTAFGPGIDRGRAIALQADGKIVVVGDAQLGGTEAYAVARYESDGTLDTTFGVGGLVTTDTSAGAELLLAVAVQPDGAVLANGITQGVEFGMRTLRYENDGDLDPTFGVGGIVPSPFSSFSEGHSVTLQPDGKILIGGIGAGSLSIARLDASGTLDPTFDGDGKATVHLGALSYTYDLAVQPNGSIVAVGAKGDSDDRDFAVARLLANGRVDPTFGGGAGVVLTDINGRDNFLDSVALQPDGNLVVAGTALLAANDYRVALARYQGNGPCEPGPAPDGDGDFVCDAGDSCLNVAGARDFLADPAPELSLKKVIGDELPGDDRIKLNATFELAGADPFADLDPVAEGARLIFYRSDGAVVEDITLSGGTYSGGGTAGWKLNGPGNRWRFLDKTDSPANGIVRMKIDDHSQDSPGRVSVDVRGKRGTYPIDANDFPLAMTVVLGDAAASAAGVCGEGVFAQ
jgi:uncharacterized delta-60 repeat protein